MCEGIWAHFRMAFDILVPLPGCLVCQRGAGIEHGKHRERGKARKQVLARAMALGHPNLGAKRLRGPGTAATRWGSESCLRALPPARFSL